MPETKSLRPVRHCVSGLGGSWTDRGPGGPGLGPRCQDLAWCGDPSVIEMGLIHAPHFALCPASGHEVPFAVVSPCHGVAREYSDSIV